MLTDGRTDGRTTDAGVTGILIAHLGAFGSGELKRVKRLESWKGNEKTNTLLSKAKYLEDLHQPQERANLVSSV